jgi:Tfp pilus assembly protein PilX
MIKARPAFWKSVTPAGASRQRGIVLIVALIALVLLSLAAIALTRSVDTGNLAAGNLAFKKRSVSASELGVSALIPKFDVKNNGVLTTGTTAYNDSAVDCYRATIFTPDITDSTNGMDMRGVPNIMLSTSSFDAKYSQCKLTVAATGEVVRFLIDRQCSVTGAPSDSSCILPLNAYRGMTDNDKPTGAGLVAPLYRITVRVDGPKNTVSYTQTMIRQ